jgi:dTDP-4-amino-4,6-dideoxygalactose transaminase
VINVFELVVGSDSLKRLERVFASKSLGRGELVREFEATLAAFLKVDAARVHTIASCSDALFGAFHILDVEPGSEVIVSSISFPAAGNAILAAGLVPRVVDVDIATGNVDLDSVAEALTPKTGAVLVTDYGGIPVDVARLRALAGNRVRLIEDAAGALGSYTDGRACGTLADFGCWSFDAMKMLTCGEGGAIYVQRSEEMTRAREYFYLGLPADAASGMARQATHDRGWEYQPRLAGRRSLFTNINAAIGLPQFDSLERAFDRRAQIREYYCAVLDRCPGVSYLGQQEPRTVYSNYFYTVVTDRRDELAAHLKRHGIYSTFRYFPLHKLGLFARFADDCPSAEAFSRTALNIPMHHALSDADVQQIGCCLSEFFRTGVAARPAVARIDVQAPSGRL